MNLINPMTEATKESSPRARRRLHLTAFVLFLALWPAGPARASEEGLKAHCYCRATLREHRTTNPADYLEMTNVDNLAQAKMTVPGWWKNQTWDWIASGASKSGSCWSECREAFGVDNNGKVSPEAAALKAQLLTAAKTQGQPRNWCGGWLSAQLEYAAGTNQYRDSTAELIGLGSRKCSETCKAQSSFTLNGSSQSEVQTCHSKPLLLDGSASSCYSGLFVSVQLSDPQWNRFGKEGAGWLPASDQGKIGSFNVASFATTHGVQLEPDRYYRVKLAAAQPWHETSKLVYLRPPRAQFTLDGHSQSLVTLPASSPLMLDGSLSECAGRFFVSVQLSDADWNRYGPEYHRWLTPPENQAISSLDLRSFVLAGGGSFAPGSFYRIKLATAEPWHEEVKLVYLQP